MSLNMCKACTFLFNGKSNNFRIIKDIVILWMQFALYKNIVLHEHIIPRQCIITLKRPAV